MLAFPCNDFGNQEPKSAKEVAEFAKAKFGATFPILDKVERIDDHPVFRFLKSARPALGGSAAKKRDNIRSGDADISWNFNKFLVDRSGTPVKRYPPQWDGAAIERDVVALLGASPR